MTTAQYGQGELCLVPNDSQEFCLVSSCNCNWTHAVALHENDIITKNSEISSMEFGVMSLEISTMLVKFILKLRSNLKK